MVATGDNMTDHKTDHNRAEIEFGTDGIRGIAGEYPLDPSTVLHIGRSIGKWMRGNGASWALIGRDTRISGEMLARALTAGLLVEGVNLSDAGVMSTPGVAFLTRRGHYDLGIVISASHNPVEQNGIKLFGPDGFKLSDDAEDAIERLINGRTEHRSAPIGAAEMGDFRELYISHLTAFGVKRKLDNLTVVLDCANGAASKLAPEAFRRDGAHIIEMNSAPDGLNINVSAGSEHVRRDRTALHEAVRANKADLGIAFDGDADRVVFVTPEGMLVDGDHTLGILALDMHKKGQLHGSTVVATEMSNSGLEHYLHDNGISLQRTKVGDKYVMDGLRTGRFALGGEQAGHVITLDDDHTAGDGIYVGLVVAALVADAKRANGSTLHDMAARIPRYPQVIASAHLSARTDLDKVEGLAALRARTLELFGGKGRVNLRFSGTEPNLLRAMVEGGPGTELNQVIESALALCKMVARATNTPSPHIDVVDCVTGAPVSV
jgi:phosphoglucosamine mutase